MFVVPPTLGSFRRPEDDPVVVKVPSAPQGWQVVYTDEEGRFACPKANCDFTGSYDSAAAS